MAIPKKFTSIDQTLKNSSCNVFFQKNESMFKRLVEFMFSLKEPTKYLKSQDPQLLDWIIEMTPRLNSKEFEYKAGTRIHWILLRLEDFPDCANPECMNKVGIHQNVIWCRGYVPYCSLKCGVRCSRDKSVSTLQKHASEDPDFFSDIVKRRKQTSLENHGDSTWNNREQAFETCFDRYGVKTPMEVEEFCAKSMSTRETKYGKGNMTNYKKTAETCLRLYGHRSVWGNPDIHKKCIDKTIKLHGSPNPGSKYALDGMKFDSMPEVAFYIWLRDNDIEFSYKSGVNFEYTHNGKTYRYYPDFIVKGQIVEIKGDHFFEDCDPTKKMVNPFLEIQDGLIESKHQCMIEHEVKIITSREYKKYLSYVDDRYGKDYIKSLKIGKSS